MPALKHYPDKTCEHCGVTFNRWIRNGRREPASDYGVRRFCTKKCYDAWHSGPNHHLFKEEGSIRYDGYVRVSRQGQRVYLHRWLMEQHLGRPLHEDEHVHHIDGNPENNVLSNLQLTTNSEHLKMHYIQRQINEKGQFVA